MDHEHRITIRTVPNSAIHKYHVSWLISQDPFKHFRFSVHWHQQKDLTKCGPVAGELVSRLSEFEEVYEIFLRPNECSVHLKEAFMWSEIEAKVLAALSATLPTEIQASVKVIYQEKRASEDQEPLGLAN